MKFWKKNEPDRKISTPQSKDGEVFPEAAKKVNVSMEYPYLIQVNDIDDGTIIRRKPFGAKKYREGSNLYLLNEKEGFKEPVPTLKDDFKKMINVNET